MPRFPGGGRLTITIVFNEKKVYYNYHTLEVIEVQISGKIFDTPLPQTLLYVPAHPFNTCHVFVTYRQKVHNILTTKPASPSGPVGPSGPCPP